MVKNKKAAIEMSMGTIIVLVLGVSMLILGMVLIRNIMCSGLQITEELTTGVKNEIKNLFGADKFGVKCMGEGGQEVKIGTGGRRKIICIVKTETDAEYNFVITEIKPLKGASQQAVDSWVLNKGWKGSVIPGTDKEVDVLLLDIPRDAPTTTLRIGINVARSDNRPETIISTIDVVTTGAIKGAIC